jgi:hypothetical protein
MKLLKKPAVALVVCLILVIGATLLNTRVRLGRQCSSLANSFYAVDGIADKLEAMHVQADALAALAEANGVNADALRNASADLQGLLSQRSVNAGQLYRYYDALRSQMSATAAQLSEKNVSGVDTIQKRAQILQDDISMDSYNTDVRSFRQRNGSFLTRFLASLAGVSIPEEFA